MSEAIDAVVTKNDVMDFIELNPYFDEMLKIFLKDKFIEDVDAIIVSEEWRGEFVKRARRWVKSVKKRGLINLKELNGAGFEKKIFIFKDQTFKMAKRNFNPIISVQNDGLKLPEPVGAWSEKKYSLVGGYCEIFNSAIKNKFSNRVYIDLFAGSGYAPIKGKNKILKSSALIALSISTPFTKYIFCEKDEEKIEALDKRVRRDHSDKDIKIIHGDSNTTVEQVIDEVQMLGRSTISFCFVDPFSLNLHFETIKNCKNRACGFFNIACLNDGSEEELSQLH